MHRREPAPCAIPYYSGITLPLDEAPIIVTSHGLVWIGQVTQIASERQDQFVLLATTEIQDRNRTISHPAIRLRLRIPECMLRYESTSTGISTIPGRKSSLEHSKV